MLFKSDYGHFRANTISHGQSTVGVLRTITEVIRFMDVQNLIDYSKVPRWLEIHLHQIISVKGATEVVRVC